MRNLCLQISPVVVSALQWKVSCSLSNNPSVDSLCATVSSILASFSSGLCCACIMVGVVLVGVIVGLSASGRVASLSVVSGY